MGRGMQCVQNGPGYPVTGKGDAAVLGKPGQAAESFGGGPLISDVR